MALDDLDIMWGIPFSIHLVLIALYVVVIFTCFKAKSAIVEIQDKVQSRTFNMKMLRAEAEVLLTKVTDEESKQAATKLWEALRYSDPVSNEYLEAYERRIGEYIVAAKTYVGKDTNGVIFMCNEAIKLVEERSIRCAATKK